MFPIMLNRMRGVTWSCVDILTQLCILIMPGFVLAILAAILGMLILLESNFSQVVWMLGGKS